MGWFDDVKESVKDTFDYAGKAALGIATGGLSLLADAADPGSPTKPPANPADDPKAIAERDAKTREEALRRLLGGLDSNIATSPMGLAQTAQVSTKSLLGS